MRLLLITFTLLLAIQSNLFPKDIAKWNFNALGNQTQFTDSVSRITTKVFPGDNGEFSVISTNGIGLAVFNDGNRAPSSQGELLLVHDNDLLTGHQEHGYGYPSLTIEFEFKPTEIINCHLIRKVDEETGNGYDIWMNKKGQLGFSIKNGKNQFCRIISKRIVKPDLWHKVTATWDSRYQNYNMQLHLDGFIAWGGAAPTTRLVNTTAPFTIGGMYHNEKDYGEFFSGYLKNLCLSYDRPELLSISGKCDPYKVKQTGEHLKNQQGFVKSEFIFNDPPSPGCHSSTIVDLGNNRLAASWFGGTHEGHTDVSIWFSVYNGKKWSKPQAIVQAPKYNQVAHISLFNPVLFKHSNGTLLLFYKEGWLGHMECRLVTSNDDGKSWSQVKYYHPPLLGPSKNKPLELSDGSLLCSASGSKMEITSDMGKTWKTRKINNKEKLFEVSQASLLIHPDNKIQALFRTREGRIAQAWSFNNGTSWTNLELSELLNNNSGIDAVTLKDGRFLLVSNPTGIPDGKWGGPRTPLTVAISDDGIKWRQVVILEDEPGEYSYPAVIQSSNGLLHITYTWNRLRIKHVVLDPSYFFNEDQN